MMADFVNYKMLLTSLSQIKALLIGPVSSGKSSFINSIRSTMYKRIVHLPNISTSVEGFTQKVDCINLVDLVFFYMSHVTRIIRFVSCIQYLFKYLHAASGFAFGIFLHS